MESSLLVNKVGAQPLVKLRRTTPLSSAKQSSKVSFVDLQPQRPTSPLNCPLKETQDGNSDHAAKTPIRKQRGPSPKSATFSRPPSIKICEDFAAMETTSPTSESRWKKNHLTVDRKLSKQNSPTSLSNSLPSTPSMRSKTGSSGQRRRRVRKNKTEDSDTPSTRGIQKEDICGIEKELSMSFETERCDSKKTIGTFTTSGTLRSEESSEVVETEKQEANNANVSRRSNISRTSKQSFFQTGSTDISENGETCFHLTWNLKKVCPLGLFSDRRLEVIKYKETREENDYGHISVYKGGKRKVIVEGFRIKSFLEDIDSDTRFALCLSEQKNVERSSQMAFQCKDKAQLNEVKQAIFGAFLHVDFQVASLNRKLFN